MRHFRVNASILFAFLLLNGLAAACLALRYFNVLPAWPTDGLGQTFLFSSMWSHFGLMTLVVGLLALPLAVLPFRWARWGWVVLASTALILLYIDTVVFALYRFHLNLMVVEMVLSGQIVSFAFSTWAKVLMAVAGVCAVEFGALHWLHRRAQRLQSAPLGRWPKRYLVVTVLLALYAHGVHIWAAANAYAPVTLTVRYLPVFYPATANSFMIKQGWANPASVAQQAQFKHTTQGDLQYPLEPLRTETPAQPINILWIVIDAWRYADFTPDIMPNTWRLAQSGQQFTHHRSTGNATRAGIFGLFYGLPATYWHSFLANRRSPVLMDRLQALGYDIQAFSSAHLTSPEFDRTVFAQTPSVRLRSPDGSPAERDQRITEEWLHWQQQRDRTQPSFSFLFYDSAHGYDFPADYPHVFEPIKGSVDYLELDNTVDPTPLHNRYKTSLHYIDGLMEQVYATLAAQGELAHTLILITSDHGEEFNDNQLNYWGHNSNFTDVQLHVPMIWLAPGQAPATIDTLTTHEDVVPTLLAQYLGVTSPVEHYSTGVPMLTGSLPKREWSLAAKYSGYAIVDDERIVEVSSASGGYQVYDKGNRLLQEAPDTQRFQDAFAQMRRFSR